MEWSGREEGRGGGKNDEALDAGYSADSVCLVCLVCTALSTGTNHSHKAVYFALLPGFIGRQRGRGRERDGFYVFD
jgi:hypothetical protein